MNSLMEEVYLVRLESWFQLAAIFGVFVQVCRRGEEKLKASERENDYRSEILGAIGSEALDFMRRRMMKPNSDFCYISGGTTDRRVQTRE